MPLITYLEEMSIAKLCAIVGSCESTLFKNDGVLRGFDYLPLFQYVKLKKIMNK